MPAEVVQGTGTTPRRARYLIPTEFPRRGEIIAVCAAAFLLVHLLLAQLTLVLAVAFAAATRVSRWRVWWLAAPAMAGLALTIAIGPGAAAAGFAAGPRQILGYLDGGGRPLGWLFHPHGAFVGAGGWLPRQLPLALLIASAEAALAGWLDWLHTDEWAVPPPRAGLIAALRGAVARRVIRVSTVVTRDGCCLGVSQATGARATLSWAEVNGGVLLAGTDGRDLAATSFQVVHAALRLRKPVITLDLTGDPGITESLTRACSATGTPLRVFGTEGGCYEPFRDAAPARRVAMTLALTGQDATAEAYLRGAFELIDLVPADPGTPVLDDILHLLDPRALRARLALVPSASHRRDQVGAQVRVAAQLAAGEPELVRSIARQLETVRASPQGRWLRPAGEIDLGHVVRSRSAVLFGLGAPWLTRLVRADITALAEDLRRIGADGDGIVWLCGCEGLPREAFAVLVNSGAEVGLPVIATTTSPSAVDLADVAGAVVIHRIADVGAAHALAARTGTRLVPASAPASAPVSTGPLAGPAVPAERLRSLGRGQFVLTVSSPRSRLVELAETVPARLPR